MSKSHTKKRGRPSTGGRDPIMALRVPTAEKRRWQAAAARRELSLSALIRQRMNSLRDVAGEK